MTSIGRETVVLGCSKNDTPVMEEVGLDWYATESEGIGGEMKTRPQDFRVDEISDFKYHDWGRYAVIEVTLTNHETHEFARDLSNELYISRKRVSWAGTKDKRAVTTQLMTVDDVEEEDIKDVDIDDAEIEFVGRASNDIHLGALVGNRFRIRVRDVEKPENIEQISHEIDEFGGIPNLFGSQRFGSRRPVSHKVGEKMLQDDFEDAVMTFLADSFEDEPQETREARERLLEQRNFGEATNYFPDYLGYEKSILNELASGKEFKEALDVLPDNLQRLFVNAVQSKLFNLILKERHREGMGFDEAYPGDVVCFTNEHGYPDTDRLQEVTEKNVNSVNRHLSRGRAFVTAPLIGHETELSEGRQGEIERQILDESGFERDDFKREDEFDSSGTRRAILLDTEAEQEIEEDTVVFEFPLPKGSYATVVMREYLKNN